MQRPPIARVRNRDTNVLQRGRADVAPVHFDRFELCPPPGDGAGGPKVEDDGPGERHAHGAFNPDGETILADLLVPLLTEVVDEAGKIAAGGYPAVVIGRAMRVLGKEAVGEIHPISRQRHSLSGEELRRHVGPQVQLTHVDRTLAAHARVTPKKEPGASLVASECKADAVVRIGRYVEG